MSPRTRPKHNKTIKNKTTDTNTIAPYNTQLVRKHSSEQAEASNGEGPTLPYPTLLAEDLSHTPTTSIKLVTVMSETESNTNRNASSAGGRDLVNYIYYINTMDGSNPVRKVHARTCITFEEMQAKKMNKQQDEQSYHFVGTLVRIDKNKAFVSNMAYSKAGGDANNRTRPYDRAFLLHDARSEVGNLVAVRCKTSEESSSFCKQLISADGMKPLLGMTILIKDVAISDNNDTLTRDGAVPIITMSGSAHMLQPKKCLWAIHRPFPVVASSANEAICRTFCFTDVYIKASKIVVTRANCGWGTCDRRISASDRIGGCVCFVSCPKNHGQLVLKMNISLHKEIDDDGKAKGDRVTSYNFLPIQSLKWTQALLGNSITVSLRTLEEWERSAKHLTDAVQSQVAKMNKMGTSSVFGWYKNSFKKNIVEQEDSTKMTSSIENATGQGTLGATSKFRKSQHRDEVYSSSDVKLHIVTISSRNPQSYKNGPVPDYIPEFDPDNDIVKDENEADDFLMLEMPAFKKPKA